MSSLVTMPASSDSILGPTMFTIASSCHQQLRCLVCRHLKALAIGLAKRQSIRWVALLEPDEPFHFRMMYFCLCRSSNISTFDKS